MKLEDNYITDEGHELYISEITLLSIEEYLSVNDIIPKLNDWWWLRSPGNCQYNAPYVDSDGSLNYRSVDRGGGCVRPALDILNLEFSSLKISDSFILFGLEWTVISYDTALCNSFIGQTSFRDDWTAYDANVYETSDIMKWIENYFRPIILNYRKPQYEQIDASEWINLLS